MQLIPVYRVTRAYRGVTIDKQNIRVNFPHNRSGRIND